MYETSDFFYSVITFSYIKCFVHSYTVDVVFTLSYLIGKNLQFDFNTQTFAANPMYWQMFIGGILVRSVASPDRGEETTGLMLPDMNNDIFLRISIIIIPKLLNLRYPVQPETLPVIY